MKLTKSKQALADAIHASGKGWPDGANWAAQDKVDGQCNDNTIGFYSGDAKPVKLKGSSQWRCDSLDSAFIGYPHAIDHDKLLPNWHQTVLSREEYFSAYPAEPVTDADGWIEYDGKGSPYTNDVVVDVKWSDGGFTSSDNFGPGPAWVVKHGEPNITHHRLHTPASDADLSSAPPTKLTIEQLAADYRNKLDYANRKQQEADDAKADVGAKLKALKLAGKEHGLLVSPITAKQDPEPELVIKVQVGDEVECIKSNVTPTTSEA